MKKQLLFTGIMIVWGALIGLAITMEWIFLFLVVFFMGFYFFVFSFPAILNPAFSKKMGKAFKWEGLKGFSIKWEGIGSFKRAFKWEGFKTESRQLLTGLSGIVCVVGIACMLKFLSLFGVAQANIATFIGAFLLFGIIWALAGEMGLAGDFKSPVKRDEMLTSFVLGGIFGLATAAILIVFSWWFREYYFPVVKVLPSPRSFQRWAIFMTSMSMGILCTAMTALAPVYMEKKERVKMLILPIVLAVIFVTTILAAYKNDSDKYDLNKGKIGEKIAVHSLVNILKDLNEKSNARWKAALSLGKIGDKTAVPALIKALKDEDSSVRREAVWALGNIGDKVDYCVCLRMYSGTAASDMGEIGDKTTVPALTETLKDKDSSVRREAAWALGRIGDKSAVPALIASLKDEKSSVRARAAWALGKMGDKRGLSVALGALKDKNSFVRRRAAYALGRIGEKSAFPALLESLKDEDSSVQCAASWALGKMGDKSGLSVALGTLKDKKSSVRRDAASALGEIGDMPAVPVLLEALKDKKSVVRREAVKALGKIGDKVAVPALITALKDENSCVRRDAASALGRIGDKTAVPALTETLKDENPYVRQAAEKAIKKIEAKTR